MRHEADEAFTKAERAYAKAETLLRERQEELSRLKLPADQSSILQHQYDTDQQLLESLGPVLDVVVLEDEADALKKVISKAQAERELQRKNLEVAQAEFVGKTARRDQLQTELKHLNEEIDQCQAALKNAEQVASAARETKVAALARVEQAQESLMKSLERHADAEQAFTKRLEEAGLTQEVYVGLKSAITGIDAMRESLETYRQNLHTAEEQARVTQNAIANAVQPDFVILKEALKQAEENLKEAGDKCAHEKQRLEHLQKLKDELSETLRELEKNEAESGLLRQIAALFDGKNQQNLDLETYAIGAMFDRVLEAANLRLTPMSANRYRLEREVETGGRGRKGLGVQAYDHFTGKGRPANTLSGGETFIFALALALGLADVVESESGKVRLDTIFIDEGFGSLDTENGSGTLDQVLRVLGNLVSEHRAVGLISHVPLVQEAIPNGFYVRKGASGSSVEVRGE